MADDRTKISELPVAQSISDTDVMVAVVDDATCKAYVPLLREAFVGAETTAREAADTALGNRIDGKQDTLTFDDEPTDGSNNPVKSNGIYDALAAKANTADLATVATSGSYNDLGDTPTIDSEMSDSSENAVQNKVVKAAIDAKADVEANPSGTATAELDKLGVNDVVYSLAGEKVYGSSSGAIATFTDGGDNKPLKSLKVAINPVQEGRGDPSPENVRPISGWTGAEIVNAGGINLFDNSSFVKGRLDNGVIGYEVNTTSMTITETGVTFTTNSNYRGVVGGLTPVVEGQSYYFKYDTDNPSNLSAFIDYYDSSSNWISRSSFSNLFTPPTNCSYVRISFQEKTSGTITVTNIAIYNANVYPITWSEAGEVFGGTITVYPDGSGEMDITHISQIYDGTENITANANYHYLRIPTSSNHIIENAMSSIFPFRDDASQGYNYINRGNTNNQFWFWPDPNGGWYDDVAAFKAFLAQQYSNNDPLQIVYRLSTPINIIFPAGTFPTITTLLGNNNIWSDTGEILECVYQRDLNIVINNLIDRVAAIERTGSTMPVVPTSDGTYDLKATVTSGSGNVAWVAEEPTPEPEE